MNHRPHNWRYISGSVLCLLALVAIGFTNTHAQQIAETPERPKYQIDLRIDFDRLSYSGSERVRWVNRGEKPTSVIYLHLYPNLRANDSSLANGPGANAPEADEPRMEILEVRAV